MFFYNYTLTFIIMQVGFIIIHEYARSIHLQIAPIIKAIELNKLTHANTH